jgi:hypothetical protein
MILTNNNTINTLLSSYYLSLPDSKEFEIDHIYSLDIINNNLDKILNHTYNLITQKLLDVIVSEDLLKLYLGIDVIPTIEGIMNIMSYIFKYIIVVLILFISIIYGIMNGLYLYIFIHTMKQIGIIKCIYIIMYMQYYIEVILKYTDIYPIISIILIFSILKLIMNIINNIKRKLKYILFIKYGLNDNKYKRLSDKIDDNHKKLNEILSILKISEWGEIAKVSSTLKDNSLYK